MASPEEKQPLRNKAEITDQIFNEGGSDETIVATVFRYVMITFSYLFLCIPITWFWCIKVFDQYERAIIFRLGKAQKSPKGPGVFIFLPFLDTYRKVDLRVMTIDVPSQEMMTKDSVTVTVNGVVYFYVADPLKSVLCAENYRLATTLLAQTTLRSVVGESELDELLQKRETINDRMTRILDEGTDPWGVKVTTVEVKDVQVPRNMQRAMGSQAEAERERRAKVISAEGELQASNSLLRAANNMTQNNATMQLRYLQTLTSISQEHNSTIVFPLPISLLSLADSMADKAIEEAKGETNV
jgi:regulator of protease activity HflC (stomatin/prohibitin superfamily)